MSTSNFISKESSNLFFFKMEKKKDGDIFFLQEKAKKQTNSILFIIYNCYTLTRCYGRKIISKAISANLNFFLRFFEFILDLSFTLCFSDHVSSWPLTFSSLT